MTDKDNFHWDWVHIEGWDQIGPELASLVEVIQAPNPVFWDTRDLEIYRPHIPSLFQWFDLKGLDPLRIAWVQIRPGQTQVVHRDIGYTLALQLPVQGCEGVPTIIYESQDPGHRIGNHNHSYINYNPTGVREIDRYVLTKPLLFQSSTIHSVQNFTDHKRYALSVRFRTDPWWLLDN